MIFSLVECFKTQMPGLYPSPFRSEYLARMEGWGLCQYDLAYFKSAMVNANGQSRLRTADLDQEADRSFLIKTSREEGPGHKEKGCFKVKVTKLQV